RKSQALEDYWHRPITAEQLQAEMDHMAQHTKQPEVLQELFDALGNDPFVIAECLARPALAERLVTSWYAGDQRIHGELKQRAEAELQAHLPAIALAEAGPSIDQMKRLSGKYSEIEFVKSDSRETLGQADRLPEKLAGGAPALQQQDAIHGLKLNGREWNETVQKLTTAFGLRSRQRGIAAFKSANMSAHSKNAAVEGDASLPVAKLSRLQEDERCYYVTTVINKSNDHLKVATVSWLKDPLQSWLARSQNQFFTATAAPGGNYTLPAISGGGCIEDAWAVTAGLPDAREGHTAVWTGSEMIVWGGQNDSSAFFNTGGRYNPSTDNWTATSATNAPDARTSHTAVWTGSENDRLGRGR
ncbi:MAG TPA: hypothetical protein VE133_17955, partial [Candidatus Sulfotelmatobacter sp.]|nr:hypothetical protein [Candidatus Sulfotelmatobacter sp.]